MELGFHSKGSENQQASEAGPGARCRWKASLGARAQLVSAPAAFWGALALSRALLERVTCSASVDLTTTLCVCLGGHHNPTL